MTRPYRAPEVILQIGYGEKIVEFAAGCILFELLTGQYLFEPHHTGLYSRDEDHLGQMIERFGTIPKWMQEFSPKRAEFFKDDGSLKKIPTLITRPLYYTLTETYMMDVEAAKNAFYLLDRLCTIDPTRRLTAKDCLKHEFFTTKYH